MKINKKISRISLIIAMSLILILLGKIVTQAFSTNGLKEGNIREISFKTMADSNNLYCVQKGAALKNGAHDYKVEKIITIEGNKATRGDKTVQDSKNAILAYILGGGNYSKGYGKLDNTTYRQDVLWEYFNTWASTVGIKFGLNWSYEDNDSLNKNRDLYKEAVDYANSAGTADIQSLVGTKVMTSNTVAGPFKVKYTGNISSVTVKATDGSTLTGITFSKTKDGKSAMAAKDIKSGEEFYIINNSGKTLQSINIKVSANNAIKATIYFLKHTSDDWQRLIAVDTETKPVQDDVTINIETLGALTINKTDEDTGAKLNAGFKVKTSKGWLSGKSGEYNYEESVEKATIYKTVDGKVSINDINFGTYGIYEVEVAEGYNLAYQKGFDKNNNWVHIGDYTVTSTKDNVTVDAINAKYGNIIINKVDEEDNNTKLRAGFKLYSENTKGWVAQINGAYTHNNSEDNATTFYTENGTTNIQNLEFGKYQVFETQAPAGYDLRAQENYKDGKALVGTANLNKNDGEKTVTFTLTNVKLISISGYVWVDVPETKANNTNSLYDNNEKRVANVTVKLINKSDKQVLATTKTDSNGAYIFENAVKGNRKLTSNTLKDYYVEFDYQGTEYKQYIPVAFNSANVSDIKENGSRAIVNEMQEKDVDFKAIATTYPGTDANKETTYGLASNGNLFNKLFNKQTNTLENINLGIKERINPDYTVSENLSYVKVVMKGYTYRYNYGKDDENRNAVAAPLVKWQNGDSIYAYSRDVYPSDISYDIKNSTEELKMYVVYRIDVTNTMNYDVEELYQEQKLHVTNLTDKFDTSRYELHDSNWTAKGDTATITNNYLKDIKETGISKNTTAQKYIEFSVKHDAIVEILKHPKGIIEQFPTEITADAYHEYTRQDYTWQNDIKKQQTHFTENDTRSAKAPYLILKLGADREATGTVFEDRVVTTNGEKLGNGIYENGENVAKDVKVELIDADASTVSNLYGVKDTTAISKSAVTTTDEKGSYSLKGIVPGDYYLRFTYGNGTQKLYDASGNEVNTIVAKDYKSTIVKSENAKKALNGVEDSDTVKEDEFVKTSGTTKKKNYIWYKKLEGTNYSVAVDNLESRKNVNAETSNEVIASTAKFSITIENTEENVANITSTESNEGATITLGTKQIFNGFNFGIITQPEKDVRIEKVVTKMRLVTSQNNQIFEGNPETDRMQGVTDLQDKQTKVGGSTYVRVEMNEDIIYDATLTLTYGIKITNISDVNYYSEKYYWYGDKTGANEVTLKIDEVVDYLDETLTYLPELSDKDRIELTSKVVEETEGDITKKKVIMNITGWDTLYTEKNTERSAKKQTSDSVTLGVQRSLSTQDDDMEIINKVQVTKASNATDPDDTSNDKEERIKIVKPMEPINKVAQAVVTITPPTGQDKQSPMIYIIAGAITLAVLSAGIVIIKKKVV